MPIPNISRQPDNSAIVAMTKTRAGRKMAFVNLKQKRTAKKRRANYRYFYREKDKPGNKGFNRLTTNIMRERGLFIGDRLTTDCRSKRPFAHTQTAAWLAGPETPINRLLVIHRTGSGKTFAMIHILDLYFSDPRAKIVVFPNRELVRNFYEKMYKTPTRYTTFVEARSQAKKIANTYNYFKSTLGMEGELHKRGLFGELAAPLRPMSYSLAGGRQVFPTHGGKPDNPIFKIDYDGKNPFDNKIILMDEVHNLIRPPPGVDKRMLKRLKRMRDALYSAKGSIIVGLTATPFVKDETDGKELLRMIKGNEYKDAPTNQGFVSYFNTLPKINLSRNETGYLVFKSNPH